MALKNRLIQTLLLMTVSATAASAISSVFGSARDCICISVSAGEPAYADSCPDLYCTDTDLSENMHDFLPYVSHTDNMSSCTVSAGGEESDVPLGSPLKKKARNMNSPAAVAVSGLEIRQHCSSSIKTSVVRHSTAVTDLNSLYCIFLI